MDDGPQRLEAPAPAAAVPHLALKATALLVLMIVLLCGAALYVMYARGVFEPTQRLVLVAENSEGVVAGMDLTFSGFPIGRVRRVELGPDGNARILIDVPRDDAHWLRTTSVFTLVRNLVGGTNLRAYSGILTDPPLEDGAVRTVLGGDATAEVPRLIASARELLQNLNVMTATGSPLSETLGGVQSLTDKLKGPGGALGVLLGGDAERQKVLLTLDRSNALLARLDRLAARLDGLAVKTDSQVFGSNGVMPEARATVVELRGLLGDARASIKKVDAVLQEAQAVGANARVATTDLGALRSEVDASLRKVEQLINEVNRKWPFARDTELRLP